MPKPLEGDCQPPGLFPPAARERRRAWLTQLTALCGPQVGPYPLWGPHMTSKPCFLLRTGSSITETAALTFLEMVQKQAPEGSSNPPASGGHRRSTSSVSAPGTGLRPYVHPPPPLQMPLWVSCWSILSASRTTSPCMYKT